MKVCPICRAVTFDDAEVCYGCMHRFADDRGCGNVVDEGSHWEPDEGIKPTACQQQPTANMPAPQPSGAPMPVHAPTRREMADAAFREAHASSDAVLGKYAPSSSSGGPERRNIVFEQVTAGSMGKSAKVFSPEHARGLTNVLAESQERIPEVPRSAAHVREKSNRKRVPVATPFDYAGWIVRFEFPGYEAQPLEVPLPVSAWGVETSSGGVSSGGSQSGQKGSLVVSISPVRQDAHAKCEQAASREALPAQGGGACVSQLLPEGTLP